MDNLKQKGKETMYKSIAWIFAGLLFPTIVFFLIPSCKTGEVCHWDITLLFVFLFLIPSFWIGIVLIFIGFNKLRKYLKYQKVQDEK